MFDKILGWISKAGTCLKEWWDKFLVPLFKWVINVVNPASVLPQMGQASGSTTVIVELDGEVVGRTVTDYNRRQLARSNGY